MHPICFHFFGRPIYWYGVLVAAGFLLAVLNWHLLGRRQGRPPGFASELGFWLMLSGLLGARLAYVAAHADFYMTAPVEILRFDKGGLIYYGGFLGGCIGLVLFARARKEPLWALGDFGITGIPLAHAVGRLGCFMNGCCFGRPCELPLAVTFPPGSSVSIEQAHLGLLAHSGLSSLPVHPTQLYETLFNLLVYAALLGWIFRKRRDGEVVALYLILYPVGRFLFERLRGDERMPGFGLNVAQELSLALLLAGAVLWAVLPRRRHQAHA